MQQKPAQQQTPSPISEYQLQLQIGHGASGTCYRAQSKKTKKTYAIKKIPLSNIKSKQKSPQKQHNKNSLKQAMKQVTLLKSLQHKHIVKYHDSFIDDNNMYIVMEYASKGDLHSILKRRKMKQEYYTEDEIWAMAYQLVTALEYLHANKIVHRDFKTLNIFVDAGNGLMVGDLGVSKIVKTDLGLYSRVGTPLYLAPQIIKYQKYDYKADIWGLGCVLYLIATLNHPFQGKNIISLGQNIVNTEPKPITRYSQRLNTFIQTLLNKDPNKRMQPKKLLKQYFSDRTTVPSTCTKIVTDKKISRKQENSVYLLSSNRSLSPNKNNKNNLSNFNSVQNKDSNQLYAKEIVKESVKDKEINVNNMLEKNSQKNIDKNIDKNLEKNIDKQRQKTIRYQHINYSSSTTNNNNNRYSQPPKQFPSQQKKSPQKKQIQQQQQTITQQKISKQTNKIQQKYPNNFIKEDEQKKYIKISELKQQSEIKQSNKVKNAMNINKISSRANPYSMSRNSIKLQKYRNEGEDMRRDQKEGNNRDSEDIEEIKLDNRESVTKNAKINVKNKSQQILEDNSLQIVMQQRNPKIVSSLKSKNLHKNLYNNLISTNINKINKAVPSTNIAHSINSDDLTMKVNFHPTYYNFHHNNNNKNDNRIHTRSNINKSSQICFVQQTRKAEQTQKNNSKNINNNKIDKIKQQLENDKKIEQTQLRDSNSNNNQNYRPRNISKTQTHHKQSRSNLHKAITNQKSFTKKQRATHDQNYMRISNNQYDFNQFTDGKDSQKQVKNNKYMEEERKALYKRRNIQSAKPLVISSSNKGRILYESGQSFSNHRIDQRKERPKSSVSGRNIIKNREFKFINSAKKDEKWVGGHMQYQSQIVGSQKDNQHTRTQMLKKPEFLILF